MNKKLRKSLYLVLPLLLVVLIVAGCMGATVTPQSNGSLAFNNVTGQYNDQFYALMKENFSSAVQKVENKYEEKTVIISLSQKSIIDYAGKQSVSAFAASEKGQKKLETIRSQQDALLKKLEKAGIKYELEYRYTAVDNAVAVKINTSHVSEIKKMSGVDKVMISRTYAVPKTVGGSTNAGAAVVNATSVYKTGVYDSSAAKKDGLDGSGMVVAILDTGLDYNHNAFQEMPLVTRYDKEFIANLLATKDMQAELLTAGGITVDDVYCNEKVPFMYDYADKDPDVYPSMSNHGTHVAGIVAGHDPNGYTDKDGNHVDEEFWGVAPNAQLVICKVFSDEMEGTGAGGAESEDIMAALEDCILLGVDVINMSLGTSAGFATTDDGDAEGDYMNDVYTRVGKAGISLVCAASNDYSSGFGGTFGTNLSSNPDSGVVGSPSTFSSALSVASISGKKSKYLLANGETTVFFQDSNDANSNPYDFIADMLKLKPDGAFEYVVIPGVGLASDYTESIRELVKGRVALIKRGDSSFQDKIELAMNFGAVGVIIYNNVAGTVRMSVGEIDDPIPSISIDMKSGQAMVSGATNRVGKLQLNTEFQAGPFMSDFSSLGCTPDLKLKPEITAHGGEITSTIPGGYGEQSGTSMASPNMAGVIALVRSYVQTRFPDYDRTQVNRLVNQLIMSTATTVLDQEGEAYSPRKQGAGLGSLDNARTTNAYLWVNNADNDYRPKFELGDDKEKSGVYTISFYVKNFGDKELSFKTNALFMTETLSTDGLAVAEQAYMLTDVPAQWVVNGKNLADGESFTVPAGQEYEIKLTVTLSDAEKKYIDTAFVNGMFVEGFAKLLSETEGQCDLALPYMGFYGDWSKAPMLDYDVYTLGEAQKDASIPDDEKPAASVYATQPTMKYMNGQYTLPMGGFMYLQNENAEQIYAEMEHNAISCYNRYYGEDNSNTYVTSYEFYGLYAGLLRGARYVDYVLKNADTGEVLEADTVYRVGKAYTNAGSTVPAFVKLETNPSELGLVSGEKYTMSFDFYLDYVDGEVAEGEDDRANRATESYEFSFYADYEAPVLQDVRVRYYDYKDGNTTKQRIYLDIDVFDNHYAQSVMLTYLDNETQTLKMVTEYVTPVYNANKNGTTTVSIEITNVYDQYKDKLYVQVDDYALNSSQYWLNLSECNMTLAPDSFELAEGEGNITLDIYETHKVVLNADYGENGSISNLNWSSSDRSVADVRNGEIVGISAGKATITASKNITATVIGEDGSVRTEKKTVKQTIEVTVTENEKKLNTPSISFDIIRNGEGKLSASKAYSDLYPGMNFKLNVSTDPWYYPLDKLTLAWSSTDSSVATVDQEGNVTTLAEGLAVIQATIVVDGTPTLYTATVTLNVQDPFVVNGVILTEYRGVGGVVEIPTDKNIIYIGEDAFKDNDTITEIVIPGSVMQIQEEAFANCTALKKVYFVSREKQEIADADIAVIYQCAFSGCTALELVDFTNIKIVSLGREAFAGCTALKEIRRMDKAASLYNNCFAGCTSLQSIDLSGLYFCGDGVFSGCTGLTDVTTGANTNLGNAIFYGCTGLKEITIHGAKIGDYAFAGCTALRKVTFEPETGKTQSAYIGANAFDGCTKLTSVTFGDQTKIWSIGDTAFANCTALKRFTLPAGLTRLGENILSGSGVKTLVITDDFDFENIQRMGLIFPNVKIELAESEERKAGSRSRYTIEDGVLYNADKTELLMVLMGTTKVSIPETVTAIGSYAFAGSNVSELFVPATVKTIGEGAFADSSLTVLTFEEGTQIDTIPAKAFSGTKLVKFRVPASVETIGSQAFANASLVELTFAKGSKLAKIDDQAFYGCVRMTEITLPDGAAEMGDGVFRGCTGLKKVAMPSVEKLGINTFYGCVSLENVTFGANATTLGDSRELVDTKNDETIVIPAYTFYGCEKLRSVTFGNKIEQINEGVFYGCEALESIELKNVSKIADYAFTGCTGLKNVGSLNKVEKIGNYAFYNCNGLTKLDLAAAKEIGAYAFAVENGGKAFNEVKIPNAEIIGDMAFYGGRETALHIPATLKSLGYGAFASSKKLAAITVDEANPTFYAVDGVLLKKLDNGGIELACFPGGANLGKSYTVADGVTRIDAYAFNGLGDNAPEKVILPWSLKVIGVSAFYESGITDYTFYSIKAPVLATVYRQDVYDILQAAADEMTTFKVPEKSLYYANFNDLMIKYSAMAGSARIESNLVLNFPENGVGYDNFVWSTYFGKKNSLGVQIADDTRQTIGAIEALEDPETVKGWLNWEVNDENKAKIEAFAALVKDARRQFNNVTEESQLNFISAELKEKLAAIETVVRELKSKFSIVTKIDTIKYNPDYKKDYKVGESFSMDGLVLTIVYDDYSTETVDMSKVKIVKPTGALGRYDGEVVLDYLGTQIRIPVKVKAASDNNPSDPGTEDPKPTEPGATQPGEAGGSNVPVIVLIIVAALAVAGGVTAFVIIRKKNTSKTENESEEKPTVREKRDIGPTIKWLIIGIICVVAVILVVKLAGGGSGDELANYTAKIYYHANGGQFEDHKSDKTIYYQSNALPLNIQHQNGLTNGNVGIGERDGYIFKGWYLGTVDANGNVTLGEAYDFTKRLTDGAEINLYAGWQKAEYVSVVLAGESVTDSDGKTYKDGDQIKELYFENGSVKKMSGSRLLSLKRNSYTFVEYYTDKECTTPVSWPVSKVEGQEQVIYAKFISGSWQIVSDADSAKTMLESLVSDNKYYVISDIDMKGATVNTSATVNATVEGNGHTISNFTVEKKNIAQTDTSLLGKVAAKASLKNLTLTDVKMNVSIKSGPLNVYFLFTDVENGAALENLTVKGSMEISHPDGVIVDNLQPENHDNWIVGGKQPVLAEGKVSAEATATIGDATYQYPLEG